MINSSTVNPLIGAGFWNFWNTTKGMVLAEALGGEEGRLNVSAHNGFLDIYLDGGMICVALLAVLILTAAWQILRFLPRKGFHVVRFVFLIVAIVCNATESFFARPSPLWFTTVLVLLDYPFGDAGAGRMSGLSATGAIRGNLGRPHEKAPQSMHRTSPIC
jgi:O-antigen ligase